MAVCRGNKDGEGVLLCKPYHHEVGFNSSSNLCSSLVEGQGHPRRLFSSLSTLKLTGPKPSWSFSVATMELRDREVGIEIAGVL